MVLYYDVCDKLIVGECFRCALVLVCELDENRLLAESLLNTLTRLTNELITSHEQKIAEVSTS